MRLSTRQVGDACARHPLRVLGAWPTAVVAIVMLVGESLTTVGAPTNNPESDRADEARFAAFPPDPRVVSDVVVIRSDQYTIDSARFKANVQDFVTDSRVTALGRAGVYLADGGGALSSEGRHTTIVPVALVDDDESEALLGKVKTAGEQGGIGVATTGIVVLGSEAIRRRLGPTGNRQVSASSRKQASP